MFVATSNEINVTALHDGGILNNTVGLIDMDKLTPLIGNRQAMADLVRNEGIDLVVQKGKHGDLSGTADVIAGHNYVMYLIRENTNKFGTLEYQDNVVFDESALNVGVGGNAGIDFFNEASPPEQQSAVNVFGFEDLISNSDMDFNDTVVRVENAVYVDNYLV